MEFRRHVFLMALWAILLPSAGAGACASEHSEHSCQCGPELKNSVPSPLGFLPEAACDVYPKIDLLASPSVFTKTVLLADLHYSGKRVLTGMLFKGESGPNGDLLEFIPDKIVVHTLRAHKQGLSAYLTLDKISIVNAEHFRHVGADQLGGVSVSGNYCARATINLKKVSIHVADSDGAGPYAVDFDVLKVTPFRSC